MTNSLFQPKTTATPTGLEGKINLAGISVLIADDRVEDHRTRIAFLTECGAAVATYRIEGMYGGEGDERRPVDHAHEINTRMRTGRHALLLLDVNTEVPGFSGWDIGERLMTEFVPEAPIDGRYEVVFLTGDPTVHRTLDSVKRQTGFSALTKTIPHRDLALIIRGKNETQGYYHELAERLETRYAALITGLQEEKAATPLPVEYNGTRFGMELKNHLLGNVSVDQKALASPAVRLVDMQSGDVRYLGKDQVTLTVEGDVASTPLSERRLYWGPKNDGKAQNIFAVMTSLVRATYILTGGAAGYVLRVRDGTAKDTAGEPIVPDGVRIDLMVHAPGYNLELIGATTKRYQVPVEGSLQGRFVVSIDQPNERVLYTLQVPHVKEDVVRTVA